LKLPFIEPSTVQRYGLYNFKSGVVERFKSLYMLYVEKAEFQTVIVAYFQRKIQLSGFSACPDG